MQKISLALVTALMIVLAAPTSAQTVAPVTHLQQLEALNAAREVVSQMRQFVDGHDHEMNNADTLIEAAEKAFKHLDKALRSRMPINLMFEYADMRIKVREKGLNDAYRALVNYGLGYVTNETPEMVVERLRDAIAKAEKEDINTVAKQMMIPDLLNRAHEEQVRFLVERVERTAHGLTDKAYYYSAHWQIHYANVAIAAAVKAGADVDYLRVRLAQAQGKACSRDTSCQRPLSYFER